MPHMHLLGKQIKVTMTPPDGETVTLVDITDWDYNWQETYWLKKPIKAKAGTRFDVEARLRQQPREPEQPVQPAADGSASASRRPTRCVRVRRRHPRRRPVGSGSAAPTPRSCRRRTGVTVGDAGC